VTRVRAFLLMLWALALAACGNAPPAPEASEAAATFAPACTAQPQAEPIPDEYHGHWDAERGDCSAGSPTRVTIRIDGVTFGDGRKPPVSADCTAGAPVLTLSRQGNRLVMTHAPDSASRVQTLHLKRCPA
jgi:hypothetical protein